MSATDVIAAFSEDQVERLTEISKNRLRYWDRTGFFSPSLAHDDRSKAYSRVYSFRDLICLQVLHALRVNLGVSLAHLRDVKEKLSHLGDDMWAKTTLYVLNKRVVFRNSDTHVPEDVVSGQGVLQIPLEIVRSNMQNAVQSLRQRDSSAIGKIERHRSISHNKPVVAGTRIPVKSIKAFAGAGYSIEQIKQEYPILTDEDIVAALNHGKAA
jgi:uncharacterized protein (DUF433 family)